eukprot:s220_g1.t1
MGRGTVHPGRGKGAPGRGKAVPARRKRRGRPPRPVETEEDELLRDLPASNFIWSEHELLDDDTKVAKRVAWLNKFGHLSQQIDFGAVAEPLDSLKVAHAMVLLRELEMQGKKVSDPTDWIKRAVEEVGGDAIDEARSSAVLGVSLDTPMDEHSKILKRRRPRAFPGRGRMWRLLSSLAVVPLVAQDPASMATAMAGQVAGIMATKAEKMVEPWKNMGWMDG